MRTIEFADPVLAVKLEWFGTGLELFHHPQNAEDCLQAARELNKIAGDIRLHLGALKDGNRAQFASAIELFRQAADAMTGSNDPAVRNIGSNFQTRMQEMAAPAQAENQEQEAH